MENLNFYSIRWTTSVLKHVYFQVTCQTFQQKGSKNAEIFKKKKKTSLYSLNFEIGRVRARFLAFLQKYLQA